MRVISFNPQKEARGVCASISLNLQMKTELSRGKALPQDAQVAGEQSQDLHSAPPALFFPQAHADVTVFASQIC